MRGFRSGVERRTCPICRSEENAILMLFNWEETQTCREKFMENKGLQINKELALKNLLVAPKIPT